MALDIGTLARNNRQIGIQLEQWANHELGRHQLTGCQSQVLLYILRHADTGASLTAIHHAYGYSKATLSGLIKHLREKGYVRVGACRGDDRRKLLFGTEKGEEILSAIADINKQAQVWLDENFTSAEQKAMDHLQRKMLLRLSQLNASNHKEASEHEKCDASTQAV